MLTLLTFYIYIYVTAMSTVLYSRYISYEMHTAHDEYVTD